ncbi:SIR2 family protein [Jejuia spongiicola]|uniref:Protein argonaute n=1 Tax=Jejuia spongiicola TaxID=2942207 RepID=A0ABT0QDG4_9FLAO|nr:SIR2 family protein [Jejuia spongiicola]MCL6294909.1 SIR2 family protein [Jejuia spongiicola]
MTENLNIEYDAFLRSIKRNKDIPHSLLIGAGASISSGIQSAYDCIWEWKKDIYISKNPNASKYYNNTKNDSVKNSIQLWLDTEGIYPKLNSEEEYSFYAEKAYPIEGDRRKYFQSLIEGKEPYIGYKLLSLLSEKEIVKAVWTTNFDGLVIKAGHQGKITPIEITLDSVDRIYRNQSRNEILSIALHGDYKYSSLKNTSEELDSQNEVFIEALERYHHDKNLIVIGYSGRDKSLMAALAKAFSKKGEGRIYWCGYGHKINPEVEELLVNARKSGREAFFVPTDGFDKTILHIAKSCFENDNLALEEIAEILASSGAENTEVSKFTQQIPKTDKYIKSNLHPITFPKEVFQFKYEFGERKRWATLKELTKDKDTCAVPFKNKVFALSTLSEINKVFGDGIKGDISRVPISKNDIKNVTNFKTLMLQAVVKSLSKNDIIESNNKDKLWIKKPVKNVVENGQQISIHNSLLLSFFFDYHKKYAFLTFRPSVHLKSQAEISKEVKQNLSKTSLEKLFNKQYDEILEGWKNTLFKGSNLKFEFPNQSGTGFEFSLSKSTSFAEIMVADKNFRAYQPNRYDKRLTQHKGVQFLEPQLIFTNINSNKLFKDFHPMRALKNHKPYDSQLNGVIYSNEINLGVICGKNYSKIFFEFLNGLNQRHKSNVNLDYLIDFPGFSTAYNIPINIPLPEDEDKWLDIEISHSNGEVKDIALNLARLITSKIEQLANKESQSTIVIFIPIEWEPYYRYEENGEEFDLHDYIKAYAASKGVSTQLIQEDTLHDNLKCQIFWWLSLSFYVKSLRTPWVLNNTEKDTAYAGIGYSLKSTGNKTDIVVGCSHIYNSEGQGLKYKLSKVDDFYLDGQANPFLSYNDAFQFGVSIRELFYNSMNKLPSRVVIHKRTRFTKDEIKGITESLQMAGIHKIDLIEINYEADARFVATSVYNGEMQIDRFPLSRGTCIITGATTALLWTHGIVPSVKNPSYRYYLGGRSIPAPLKIIKHHGDSNINTIATEILGLTKMNWNSFDLYTKLPATINSSNQIARIGKLLSRFEGKTYDYRLFI